MGRTSENPLICPKLNAGQLSRKGETEIRPYPLNRTAYSTSNSQRLYHPLIFACNLFLGSCFAWAYSLAVRKELSRKEKNIAPIEGLAQLNVVYLSLNKPKYQNKVSQFKLKMN
jgi:hypothetical protein